MTFPFMPQTQCLEVPYGENKVPEKKWIHPCMLYGSICQHSYLRLTSKFYLLCDLYIWMHIELNTRAEHHTESFAVASFLIWYKLMSSSISIWNAFTIQYNTIYFSNWIDLTDAIASIRPMVLYCECVRVFHLKQTARNWNGWYSESWT